MTTAIATPSRPLLPILTGLSGAHLLNDLIQSMIPAMYPLLKATYQLDFFQVGMITLAFQVTSSLLQPLLGYITDRKPWPYAMVAGMASTLAGLLALAFAPSYSVVLLAAALVGLGSAVFHPEATRMARHAAAGQQGFAQGIFQIGGHVGYSVGPLLVAALIMPYGQSALAWLTVVALVAMALMAWIGSTYAAMRREQTSAGRKQETDTSASTLPPRQIAFAMAILIVLLLSKNAIGAAFTSYYTFYLIEKFGVTVRTSQVLLFVFLVVGAIGVVAGGILGDRIGRSRIIWFSILGALPFALAIPYANLSWTILLSILVSLITASAFSAILIYAIDLVPHRVGLVGGLFYGLAFGLGGIAAMIIGLAADRIGIVRVFDLCLWLPALGLLAVFLPRRQAQ
jgi:MFS transporter, FSR family, fosmidomycin resistance protein